MMESFLQGVGNEVFIFWSIVLVLLLIMYFSSPYLNRILQNRQEEQLQELRAAIGQINTHRTESSPRFRRIEAINRHARGEEASRSMSAISESSVQSVSSRSTVASISSDSRSIEICPICLENVQLGVAPLCNHLLCGGCMIGVFQYSETYNCRCPVCRREITMIIAHFTRGERQAPIDSRLGERRSLVIETLTTYNRRYLRENLTILDQIVELPQLINHFVHQVFINHEGMIPVTIRIRCGILIVMSLIYWLSPFDLYSEAWHGIFGFLDDMGILMCTIIYVNCMYRRLVADAESYN